MEGPAMEVGIDPFNHKPNTAFEALLHGYVVLCAGIRGRNTGMDSQEFFVGGSGKRILKEEKLTGRAPAIIVDMKAAIRYMRYNADVIPRCGKDHYKWNIGRRCTFCTGWGFR